MSTYSPPTVIYTLSLHDALPIFSGRGQAIAAPHGALVVQRERDLSPRADLQRVGRERQAAIRGSRAARAALYRFRARRSEERRVGKECRSRWALYDVNKNAIALV